MQLRFLQYSIFGNAIWDAYVDRNWSFFSKALTGVFLIQFDYTLKTPAHSTPLNWMASRTKKEFAFNFDMHFDSMLH